MILLVKSLVMHIDAPIQSRAPLSAELACWWQKMLIQAFEVRATGTKL